MLKQTKAIETPTHTLDGKLKKYALNHQIMTHLIPPKALHGLSCPALIV